MTDLSPPLAWWKPSCSGGSTTGCDRPAIAPDSLTWVKAAASGDQGACVEAARVPGGGIFVRDSKDRSGPAFFYAGAAWTDFLAGGKAGEFDLPSA